MIEGMIEKVKHYLPLKILEVYCDKARFNMYGTGWSFYTLSVWRICTNDKMILGCFDEDSSQIVNILKNIEILDITFQSDSLKIDPVFILSNNQRMEIFSTDTYEPWVFNLDDVAIYVATPSEPNAFDTTQKQS